MSQCGKILLRFYYENGFGLAGLGLIWISYGVNLSVNIKCTWNLCPSKWYGLVSKPNKAIAIQCRFCEHHRQHTIELMKYKLYFEVSFVAVTNDILVEIAELDKALATTKSPWTKKKTIDRVMCNLYTPSTVQCTYETQNCTLCTLVNQAFYFCA